MRNYAVSCKIIMHAKMQNFISTLQAPLCHFTVTPKYLECMWYLSGVTTIGKTFHHSVNQLEKLTNTKVEVFTDSVPCLGGRCQEYSSSVKALGKHIEYFVQSNEYRELHDLTNHRVQFDWRICPGPRNTKISKRSRN